MKGIEKRIDELKPLGAGDAQCANCLEMKVEPIDVCKKCIADTTNLYQTDEQPVQDECANFVLGRCSTCKYWEQLESSPRIGNCSSKKFKYGYSIDDNEIPDDGAVIEFDESWGWNTAFMFGCIHYAFGDSS